MKYTWEKNEDVEFWINDDFDSIEECIKNAKESYGYSSGDTIAVGIVESYEISICADSVLEELSEDAYEECGEVAESWNPDDASTEEIGKLADRLTECVKKWLDEQGNMPSFSKVRNVRTVKIT